MLTANSWIFYLAQWVILIILSISWRYFRDLFLRVAAPQIGIAMLLVSVFWVMGEKETAGMLWTAFPVYHVPLLFAALLTGKWLRSAHPVLLLVFHCTGLAVFFAAVFCYFHF
ncbi:hypothetical protein [Pseudocitrobacter corydidari]|nr:hypothetical protein [Pseudocitrobacter corydidari]